MDEHISNIQAAIDAGKQLADPKPVTLPDGGIGYVIPHNMRLETMPAVNPILPDAISQAVTLDEASSFVDYINRFKEDDSVIFASLADNKMQAILNYHGVEGRLSGRGSHRVTFNFPYSVPWAKWRAVDGKAMTQAELGYFLEEMLLTITDPSHATLLECASDLTIERSVRFTSGTRKQSGTNELHYKEEDETRGRDNGKLIVPEDIHILCPLFQGSLATTVQAKLRYRMHGGKLTFHFDIIHLVETEQAAFQATATEVSEATGVPVFFGKPSGSLPR